MALKALAGLPEPWSVASLSGALECLAVALKLAVVTIFRILCSHESSRRTLSAAALP